jgi:SAM-dependent methyltransferase
MTQGASVTAAGKVLVGTRQEVDALRGGVLLQTPEEWTARNQQLATTMRALIAAHLRPVTGRALDVGCMQGELTDRYGEGLGMQWYGIDPDIDRARSSDGGALLSSGIAHELDFPGEFFDCITFANVYEHVSPELRSDSISELYRALTFGGILVGQLPNPYFPIESHSRLPFFGYCPRSVQRWYWRFTPTGWDFEKAHFFSVTIKDLRQTAERIGFNAILVHNFNYSLEAVPSSLRWIASLHGRLGVLPWAWQFVFQKPLRP